MFDLGWTELLVIGVVALIVVGPKDLPKMFRTLGQFTAKARSMAREFQRAMDDAADSTGVKDVARDLRKVTDPKSMGLDEVNKLRNWDPLKDSDAKGKPAKPAAGKPAATSADDDEEAMDRIAAEMDSLRKDRAPKPAPSDTPVKDAQQVAAPKPQDAAPPSDKTRGDAPDKSKA
jgi:sec-independent protein translocase protein TatB